MNKFTKISATALFALFLTACDKPADKAAAAPKAEATPAAQQQAAAPAAQQAATVDQAALADFKKIIDWNKAQEAELAALQDKLQEAVKSGDKAKVEEEMKAYSAKVDDVLKSLDGVEVKDAEVVNFKGKTKDILALSKDLMIESIKVMANPDAKAQESIQEKAKVLLNAGHELQQLQQQLHQKLMPAPAAAPAPAAK